MGYILYVSLLLANNLNVESVAKCNIRHSGVFQLALLNVTKELNNTIWRCDIKGKSSQDKTVAVIETPKAILRLVPVQVKLGYRLDIICEYPEPITSSTWYKDRTKVLFIRRTNGKTCMEETFGMDLSDNSITYPRNSDNSTFGLTFLKVKQDLNATFWDCFIDNNTFTSSGSKVVTVLVESGSGNVGDVTTANTTGNNVKTSTNLLKSSTGLGTAGALLIGAAAGIFFTLIVASVIILIRRRMKTPSTLASGTADDPGVIADVQYDLPLQPVQQDQPDVASAASETRAPGSVYSNLHADSQDYEHMYGVMNRGTVGRYRE